MGIRHREFSMTKNSGKNKGRVEITVRRNSSGSKVIAVKKRKKK
jgi:hypothetical protein